MLMMVPCIKKKKTVLIVKKNYEKITLSKLGSLVKHLSLVL